MWQDLVPPTLPTKNLTVTFDNFNPYQSLASFDFAGFIFQERAHSRGEQTSSYLDSYSASRISPDRNYYGPLFSILIKPNSIEFEEYGGPDAQCQATSMNLLRHLLVDLNLKCRWLSHSWYYDNHERSEYRRGTEKEILERL